ncbi:MAG: hypothetical protein R3B47_08925 [Bacteroidia bacterium]
MDQGPDFIGVYEIGKVIPVFETESEDFVFSGGVYRAGLRFRQPYPFWKSSHNKHPL